MLEALVSVTAENTTTLIDVQHQAAATAASVKEARTYMATVVKNTDWEANGKKISAILDKAMREDRAALNSAGEAAREMRDVSVGLSHKVSAAAEAQQDASRTFHSATERLLGVMEAHQAGKWRRVGVMALIAALCGAVGFFAIGPANRYEILWDARDALKINAHGPDCDILNGQHYTNEDVQRRGCVVWENVAQ
ncbi:hypothetical protein ACOI1H_21905 [Loktanella sp. DJP18]|uniref:hypothetical protein n=1 Tax=Loktanella sp. DJP18 TaxID=3409788 RepID=UPI003BB7FA85